MQFDLYNENMAAIKPATVVSWMDFERNPEIMYNLFSLNHDTREFTYNPDKVSLLVETNQNDRGKRIFRVETPEDLKAVERQILEKPMLLRCQLLLCKGTELIFIRLIKTWRDSFAVLLNPMSPEIREPMKQKFDEAMNLLCQGKKFSLEFDAGEMLKKWYSDLLQNAGNPLAIYRSVRCTNETRVTITNHTPYNHCFDCNIFWCVLCLPCWLLSAPCYKCQRFATSDDIFLSIDVPITRRTTHHLIRCLTTQIANERTSLVNNRSSITAGSAEPVADIRYVDQNAVPVPVAPSYPLEK